MLRKIKALTQGAFLIGLGLLSSVEVYANTDDDNILDLIPFGALAKGFGLTGSDKTTELCKNLEFKSLYCGDGSGGYVDNFYVIYIDKDRTAAKGPPLFDPGPQQQLYSQIPASECNADSIEYTRVSKDDLPPEMQAQVDAELANNNKKAVYHRIRVYNGSGSILISIFQFCEK